MNTTKYAITLVDDTAHSRKELALMSSEVSNHAIRMFCNACVDDFRTQRCYALDMDTGEVVFDTDDDDNSYPDDEYYPDDFEPFDGQYDELNYDPYMGCDYYECESIDDLCYGSEEW